MSIPHPTTATAQDLKRLVLSQCKEYIHSQTVRVLNLCLVLHAVPGDDEREVRLIFAGKLLAPPHARICSPSPASSDAGPSFSIRDGAVVHAVISAKKSGAAAVPCFCSSSILNVLSVGGETGPSSSPPAQSGTAALSPPSPSAAAAPARGFDLLRSPPALVDLFPELLAHRDLRLRDPRTIRGLSQSEVPDRSRSLTLTLTYVMPH